MNPFTHLKRALAAPSPRPLYARLAAGIEALVREGALPPGGPLPSERDLVARLGVSRKTVRAALARLAARKLVVSAQGSGHFVRNDAPDRALRVLVPERFRPDHWGGPAMHYDWIHRAEADCRCKVHYLYAPSDEQMLASLMDRDHGFDAALLFRPPSSWVSALLRERRSLLRAGALPLLVVNRDLRGTGLPFVTSDHRGAAARATAHLAALGHRRVLLLVSPRDPFVCSDVVAGYREALRAAGLPLSEERVLPVEDPARPLLAAKLGAFLRRRPSTALVAGGSVLAASLGPALADLGLALPRDLSVVAIAEPEPLRAERRRWTALVQQNQLVATAAMRRLCALARGGADGPVEERIPARFQRGATCAAPRPAVAPRA
jgi:DNA-binding LacI/PurR family transcriptional regulator/DNA-binding transcriptional regulator YhcF (GntR family)